MSIRVAVFAVPQVMLRGRLIGEVLDCLSDNHTSFVNGTDVICSVQEPRERQGKLRELRQLQEAIDDRKKRIVSMQQLIVELSETSPTDHRIGMCQQATVNLTAKIIADEASNKAIYMTEQYEVEELALSLWNMYGGAASTVLDVKTLGEDRYPW